MKTSISSSLRQGAHRASSRNIPFKRIVLAGVLASAASMAVQAQTPPAYLNVNLNATNTIAGDAVAFKGSFTYNNVVYGPSTALPSTTVTAPTANSINLASFAADTLYYAGNTTKLGNDNTFGDSNNDGIGDGGSVVYRAYRQAYSGILANLTKGPQSQQIDRLHFVKAIVGQDTPLAALANTGTYDYEGIAFSNFPSGKFNYSVDLATKTGSGDFRLEGLMVPGSWGEEFYPGQFPNTQYRLDIVGTLETASIVANANNRTGAGVVGGAVTAGADVGSDARLWDIIVDKSSYDATNAKYYLNFFGPQAVEVAGTIIGLPERIGGVAIIGKR